MCSQYNSLIAVIYFKLIEAVNSLDENEVPLWKYGANVRLFMKIVHTIQFLSPWNILQQSVFGKTFQVNSTEYKPNNKKRSKCAYLYKNCLYN